MMNDRPYPFFSACGLNCGLCPRHYTQGASRCPGCGGEGFAQKHPACGVLSCSRRKGVAYCFECGAFPCEKYAGADTKDSFITHKNQLVDLQRARDGGMRRYQAELDEKMELLRYLLAQSDDGRRKSLFCLAVNLLALQDTREIVARAREMAAAGHGLRERAAATAALFQERAEACGCSLKLRKQQRTDRP